MEKVLECELRGCEVETMDKIAENLEDGARRYNSKILHWHANKLMRNIKFNWDLSQLKIGNMPQSVARKKLKRNRQNILKM